MREIFIRDVCERHYLPRVDPYMPMHLGIRHLKCKRVECAVVDIDRRQNTRDCADFLRKKMCRPPVQPAGMTGSMKPLEVGLEPAYLHGGA